MQQAMECLQIREGGVYVDATCGGGGHSARLLDYLVDGHLYAFDQDPDSHQYMANRLQTDLAGRSSMFTMIADNFRRMTTALARLGVMQVDGVLVDLGVSSHQISTPARGFSTRFHGPLDMRMNPATSLTAAHVLNTYAVGSLRRLFRDYADLTEAHAVAKCLVRARTRQPLQTTHDLKKTLKGFAPFGREAKFFAKVFQAIRMEVNDEVSSLQVLLGQCAALIRTGGRLVMVSYHSYEDRLVKRFLRHGHFGDTPTTDVYGHRKRLFCALLRTPLRPSMAEVISNPAARSAKLRVGVRTDHAYQVPSIQ